MNSVSQGIRTLSIKNPNAKYKIIVQTYQVKYKNVPLNINKEYFWKQKLLVSSNTNVHTYFNYRRDV